MCCKMSLELGTSIRHFGNLISHNPFCRLVRAKKLVEAGCMSLSDLRTNKFSSILTKAQTARLKYLGIEECKTNPQEAEDVLV